jgi:cinnamoyl-CoA reductase
MATTTVCVTGATGFIASHLVAQLLAKGYAVKGTVRDATDEAKCQHLQRLPGAEKLLKLFSVNLSGEPGRFDECVSGCAAVFHTATPILMGAKDGRSEILEPAMSSTKELLTAVAKAGSVKTFVLTSSMSAVAPVPEPPVKTEAHWSDDAAQEAKGNFYGCTKTRQERLAQETLAGTGTRFVAINPTGVFGPMLQPGVNMTMQWMAGMTKGPQGGRAKNDSMSFVDVRDVAAMHVAAMENESAAGRHMCLAGTPTERRTESGAVVYASTHWNEVYAMIRELHPSMPPFEMCEGEPILPTSFDLTKSNGLLHIDQMRDVKTILRDSLEELQRKGAI